MMPLSDVGLRDEAKSRVVRTSHGAVGLEGLLTDLMVFHKPRNESQFEQRCRGNIHPVVLLHGIEHPFLDQLRKLLCSRTPPLGDTSHQELHRCASRRLLRRPQVGDKELPHGPRVMNMPGDSWEPSCQEIKKLQESTNKGLQRREDSWTEGRQPSCRRQCICQPKQHNAPCSPLLRCV